MLSDYQTAVDSLLQQVTSGGQIGDRDRDAAIAAAVLQYSGDKPLVWIADVRAAAPSLLPRPPGWVEGLSSVESLEYPIGDDPPQFLRAAEISDYRTPASYFSRVPNLPAGAVVRVNYTVRHQLTGPLDSIPLDDREAVVCLATAGCLDKLANASAGDTDPTVAAGAVQQVTRSQAYAARAREMRRQYFALLGINPDKPAAAAGVVVELKTRRGLTHHTRRVHGGAGAASGITQPVQPGDNMIRTPRLINYPADPPIVTNADELVLILNSSDGPVPMVAVAPNDRQEVTIKDFGGTAGLHPITFEGTIDGELNPVLVDNPYGWVKICFTSGVVTRTG
jgi:hypothetical protein